MYWHKPPESDDRAPGPPAYTSQSLKTRATGDPPDPPVAFFSVTGWCRGIGAET